MMRERSATRSAWRVIAWMNQTVSTSAWWGSGGQSFKTLPGAALPLRLPV